MTKKVFVISHDDIQRSDSIFVNPHGMTVWATALIVVGDMAGGGLIALPGAMKQTSWIGVVFLLLYALLTGYTGVKLGQCWTILQNRWPTEYREHTRKPYQEIAMRSFGPSLKHITSICIDITLFGDCVAYLVVSSQNISKLLSDWFDWNVPFCLIMIILAVILLPLTFLGSPKDFWFVVAAGMVATTVATILLIVGMAMDITESGHFEPNHTNQTGAYTMGVSVSTLTFKPFLLGLGTIMYAYGGQSAFPIIQHDMKNPSKFGLAVKIAYAVIFFMYIPIAVFGFLTYGQNVVEGNVIESIETEWLQSIILLLFSFHFLLTIILLANPVTQEMEEIFRIPQEFGWKRVLIRTIYVVVILFIAESIPRFSLLVSLLGSSTKTCLTFILPGLFYTSLKWQQQQPSAKRKFPPFPIWEFILILFILLIGVIGAITGTYAAVDALIEGGDDGSLTPPCYIDWTTKP